MFREANDSIQKHSATANSCSRHNYGRLTIVECKLWKNPQAPTLAVFRACLPRRGRKAEDDRRFLEALHFFAVENVQWRALPEADTAPAVQISRILHLKFGLTILTS